MVSTAKAKSQKSKVKIEMLYPGECPNYAKIECAPGYNTSAKTYDCTQTSICSVIQCPH